MENILSIQSHVAHGAVGNRAAVFILQRLGFEVIAVDTVAFSNHTGYGRWRGRVFTPEEVAAVLAGVAELGVLADCVGTLSGYLGGAGLGRVVVDAALAVKAANPRAVFLCDPVMGDVGRGFFVGADVRDFLRAGAVPAADIVTPNHFELEALAGRPVTNLAQALEATAAVRALGPRWVLVTSLLRADGVADEIEMLLDGGDGVAGGGAWLVATPRLGLEPPPGGAGDAVAALFFGRYLRHFDAPRALGEAAAAIHAVLEETARGGGRELRLVAAQEALVAPNRRFAVKAIR